MSNGTVAVKLARIVSLIVYGVFAKWFSLTKHAHHVHFSSEQKQTHTQKKRRNKLILIIVDLMNRALRELLSSFKVGW